MNDYQMQQLYGPDYGGTINAQDLNSYASGPNDWQTVLTNGISHAALNGINGAVNNWVDSGQIKNAGQAVQLGVMRPGGGNMVPLLLVAAVLYAVLK